MSKPLLAFCSFVVGVFCSAFVLAFPKADAQGLVSMPNAIPQVPQIQFRGVGSTFNDRGGKMQQQLDGFECDRCIMNISRLSYGGGAVALSNCKLPAKANIELKGAALNTFSVLRSLGYLTPQAKSAVLEIKTNFITLKALDGVKTDTDAPNKASP